MSIGQLVQHLISQLPMSSTPLTSPVRFNKLNQPARFSFGSSAPGNSPDSAKNIGTLGRSYSFSGDVGGRDLDHFKFKISNKQDFRIAIENEGNRNIITSLLDSRGELLFIRNNPLSVVVRPDKESGFIVRNLKKGTYFVRLSSGGRGEDYNMSLETQSPN